MDDVTMTVEGLDELAKALQALPESVARGALSRALQSSGELLEEAAALKIHTITGMLERKLKTRIEAANEAYARVVVVDTAKHAHLVEFGHRIVRGGPRRTRRGRDPGPGHVVGQVPPHSFLRASFDENAERAVEVFEARLWDNIEAAWELVRVDASGGEPDAAGAGDSDADRT